MTTLASCLKLEVILKEFEEIIIFSESRSFSLPTTTVVNNSVVPTK